MRYVTTAGVHYTMGENANFVLFIYECLDRYNMRDWGDLPEEDKKLNDLAVKRGDERIVARYNNPHGDIYIITEWDRSVTTILFTHEY